MKRVLLILISLLLVGCVQDSELVNPNLKYVELECYDEYGTRTFLEIDIRFKEAKMTNILPRWGTFEETQFVKTTPDKFQFEAGFYVDRAFPRIVYKDSDRADMPCIINKTEYRETE